MAALSLLDVLADLPDPRSRHGQRHPLGAVLGLVCFAVLLGRRSLEAIAQLGRDAGTPLAHALGFRRGKTPSKSTLSRFLRALDPQAVEAALSRWVRARCSTEAELISLDGKTLKGSREGEVPGQHLLSAYAAQAEAVLAQVRVEASTNEHKAALRLLGILPLAGRVVIGDAIFCQRDLAAQVRGQGGDYVLIVKDNQEGLAADIAAGFGYEAGSRSIAAATGVEPVFPPRTGRPPGQHDGQEARPTREADAADDYHPDAAPALAGPGARVCADPRADGAGADVGGGRLRHHQPAARAGGRGAVAAAGAPALAD
jgi:DDE_Tnp_1-associated/Transposase DDE domain